jgi:GH15 family glucan-1,4-alpha-glucosidase
VEDSLVLETTFEGAEGAAVLTDALCLGVGEREHDIGLASPHVLVRRVECGQGSIGVEFELSARPGYGLVEPELRGGGRRFEVSAGSETFVLHSTVPLTAVEDSIVGRFTLDEGQAASFVFAYQAGGPEPDEPTERREARADTLVAKAPAETDVSAVEADAPAAEADSRALYLLEDTAEGWRSWSALHQRYEGPWEDLVRVSGRVLQGLTYRPSGAIIAAPTTSLPEEEGGTRNWDYRFAWLRDSSMIMQALWVAACPDEAAMFFSWMAQATEADVEQERPLQIVYGVEGERDLVERELPHLSGWRGSRPVRTGNGAYSQQQVDIYGEILDAAHQLAGSVDIFDAPNRQLLAKVAEYAALVWREPDQGIWEMRGEPRHHVYSKLMCWVALDRAATMAAHLGVPERKPEWEQVREQIREAIETRGWNARRGAFVQAFDTEALDASVLMLPIVGFLPATDPRVLSTIEAVEKDLTDARGLVYRYRSDDGLTGQEGPFLLCTYWLVQCLALSGQVDRARRLFEQVTGYANDLGLLAEEVYPERDELLGNYPQGLSHIGLVNAVWAIHQAESGDGG